MKKTALQKKSWAEIFAISFSILLGIGWIFYIYTADHRQQVTAVRIETTVQEIHTLPHGLGQAAARNGKSQAQYTWLITGEKNAFFDVQGYLRSHPHHLVWISEDGKTGYSRLWILIPEEEIPREFEILS